MSGPRMRKIPRSQWRPISREQSLALSAIARDMMAGRADAKPGTVTGRQVRAARAGLGHTVEWLAAGSGVTAGVIRLYEDFEKVDRLNRDAIVRTLESSGAAFVAGDDIIGVFLR